MLLNTARNIKTDSPLKAKDNSNLYANMDLFNPGMSKNESGS